METTVNRLGLIGGLGPESTIDYYRRIIQVWQEETPESAPSILIDSLDVDHGIHLVQHDRPGLIRYLLESAARLEAAGASVLAIAANTPHVVFDDLEAGTRLPWLSIVAACADAAVARGFRTLGLLGTRFTMEAPLYPDVFARQGLRVVAPTADDRDWLHQRYIGELLRGDFREETREGVLALIRRLQAENPVDALILGGTELPLLLRAPVVEGLPTLDTTELHVRAIVAWMRTPRCAAA